MYESIVNKEYSDDTVGEEGVSAVEMLVYDMPCKHAHTDRMLQSWLW